MVIDMNEAQVRTLEQVRQVLAGTQVMEFQAGGCRRAALCVDRDRSQAL
jgi:hypothetical protein